MSEFLVVDADGEVEKLIVTESLRMVQTFNGSTVLDFTERVAKTSLAEVANVIIHKGREFFYFRGRMWWRAQETTPDNPPRPVVCM